MSNRIFPLFVAVLAYGVWQVVVAVGMIVTK